MLTTAVQSARSIVVGNQAKATSGAMSVEYAQKTAKDALRPGGRGRDPPFKTKWDGQNMLSKVKDGSVVHIIGPLVNGMCSNKDGKTFAPTMFARPGQQTPAPKPQYIVKVAGWNWMVSSGLYTDDMDVILRQALSSSLALVLAVCVAAGMIGLLVSRSLLRKIGGGPTHAFAIMTEVAEANRDAQLPAAPPGLHARRLGPHGVLAAQVGDRRALGHRQHGHRAQSEQRQGIAQVNTAMNQLDQMTQQNSAQLEESTAASDSLHKQAMKLIQLLALFRVNGSTSAPAPASRPAGAPRPPVPPAVRATAPRPALAKAPTATRPATPSPAPAAALPPGQAVLSLWVTTTMTGRLSDR